jgi:hypothetical protein
LSEITTSAFRAGVNVDVLARAHEPAEIVLLADAVPRTAGSKLATLEGGARLSNVPLMPFIQKQCFTTTSATGYVKINMTFM